jgi:hypothetical protein
MSEPDLEIPAFRASPRRKKTIDPAMLRIAGGAGGIALIVIVVALLWGGVHTGFGPPPVLQPPPGPMRIVPTDPGGLQVPGSSEQIMSGQAASGPPSLAPAPATPDIAKLETEASPPKSNSALQSVPAVSPAPQTTAPAGGIEAAPATLTQPVPALQAAGTVAVQLAALTNEHDATDLFDHLTSEMPTEFAGKAPDISKVSVNGTIYWRLRVGGFSDDAAAAAFCTVLHEHHAACELARF